MATPHEDPPKVRILSVASQLLQRHGMRRFRVVDVAEAAGMTHPNVYRYFTSRTALLDELVAQWLRPLEERVQTVVAAPDPVPDKLERMVTAVSRSYRLAKLEEPALFEAFAAAMAARRGVARKHRLKLQRAFDRVVDEGIASGVIVLRERAKAQALLQDCVWRFTDPQSILTDQDEGRTYEARLSRVLEAAISSMTSRSDWREN